MISDIDTLTEEIVSRLKPLDLDKIILFGSYAKGNQTEDSDIDLFLLKDVSVEQVRTLKIDARRNLKDLVHRFHLGFDILVSPESLLLKNEDPFHQIDILRDGRVIYAK